MKDFFGKLFRKSSLVNDEDGPEIWHEAFYGQIPKDDYRIELAFGYLLDEDIGVVYLRGEKHDVKVDFDDNLHVRVLNRDMLDSDNFEQSQVTKYQADNFSNVVYQVEHSRLIKNISTTSFDIFKQTDQMHFVFIGRDLVVDVVVLRDYGEDAVVTILDKEGRV